MVLPSLRYESVMLCRFFVWDDAKHGLHSLRTTLARINRSGCCEYSSYYGGLLSVAVPLPVPSYCHLNGFQSLTSFLTCYSQSRLERSVLHSLEVTCQELFPGRVVYHHRMIVEV